jgi:methylmalonyl-CoA mutase
LIIPPARVRYLSEITDIIKNYDTTVKEQSVIASALYKIDGTIAAIAETKMEYRFKKQLNLCIKVTNQDITRE